MHSEWEEIERGKEESRRVWLVSDISVAWYSSWREKAMDELGGGHLARATGSQCFRLLCLVHIPTSRD